MDARYRRAYEEARAARLAELRSSGGFTRNRVLAALLAGAVAGVVAGLVGGPLVGVVAALVGAVLGLAAHALWIRHLASDAGTRARVALWAEDRGYVYAESIEPRGTVPFLRNREDPEAEHCFSGPIAGGHGLLYDFTYITWETRTISDSNGTRTQRERVTHRYTVLEVERPLPVARLTLGRRTTGILRGLTDRLDAAFTDQRGVRLESEEFDRQFHLEVADDADELVVRRLFEPAVIVAFIEGEVPEPRFQYEHGTFVFWRDGHFSLDDLDPLDDLVAAAAPAVELLARSGDRVSQASR